MSKSRKRVVLGLRAGAVGAGGVYLYNTRNGVHLRNTVNANLADRYAKKYGGDQYYEKVVENGANGPGASRSANKKYAAAKEFLEKRARGETAVREINPASIRMVKDSNVWKFVKIGAAVAEHE